MSVHSVSKRGRRPQNEDKHNIILNIDGTNKDIAPINFFGLYDGHGGKHISDFLSNNLPKFFTDKRVKYPLVNKYIMSVYDHFQNVLRTKYKEISTNCGSTCLVAIQFEQNGKNYLNVLNTGDSRCVLCTDNFALSLTKDHKPGWPEEMLRIKKLGGKIYFDGHDWRVGDLSVSRAFGDIESEPYVTNKPEVFTHKLTKNDKFIILGCDGLWDVMSNQDAVNYVLESCYDIDTGMRINKRINIAKQLADLAILKGSGDNITIIVVFFD
jgi:protein phosphatase 2C family protein 2/3